jgi:hypothetical protein
MKAGDLVIYKDYTRGEEPVDLAGLILKIRNHYCNLVVLSEGKTQYWPEMMCEKINNAD